MDERQQEESDPSPGVKVIKLLRPGANVMKLSCQKFTYFRSKLEGLFD